MTAKILDGTFKHGAFPMEPFASAIALEASVTEDAAAIMLNASWIMAEVFTRRTYRAQLSGELIVEVTGGALFKWPRWPAPDAVEVHLQSAKGEWLTLPAYHSKWLGVELDGPGVYRIAQVGTTPAPTIPANVTQAVASLALYQLVHMPQRSEFKTQSAGDSSFTRNAASQSALFGSGAGALLQSEVLA